MATGGSGPPLNSVPNLSLGAADSPPMSLTPGATKGIPREVVEGEPDPKFLCGICNLLLRSPVQNQCGHRYCRPCVDIFLSDRDTARCPPCEKEEGATASEEGIVSNNNIFNDNAIRRDFRLVSAKCINKGCDWKDSLRDYQAHEAQCPFRMVECPCGRYVPFAQLEKHKETDCPQRKWKCPDCHQEMSYLDKDMHLDQCDEKTIKCDHCQKANIKRKEMHDHQQRECQFASELIDCPFKCPQMIRNPQQHKDQHVSRHLDHVRHELEVVQSRLTCQSVNFTSNIQSISSELQQLKTKVDASTGSNAAPSPGPTEAATGPGGGHAMSSGRPPPGQPPGAEGDKLSEQQDTNMESIAIKIRDLTQKIDTVMRASEVMVTDYVKLDRRMMIVERPGHSSVDNGTVEKFTKALEEKEKKIEELTKEINLLAITTYDGTLSWRINGVARSRNEAQTGRQLSIYSPPFYTSKTGYKLCTRLYFQGDGMGRGTHMSLYFVVMRGPYDPILKWPFGHKVTLTLLDQKERSLHITDTFRPDPSSTSFRQPQTDMNIASGCPLFCPLDSLEQPDRNYILNDTMFIRVSVDLTDYKAIL